MRRLPTGLRVRAPFRTRPCIGPWAWTQAPDGSLYITDVPQRARKVKGPSGPPTG